MHPKFISALAFALLALQGPAHAQITAAQAEAVMKQSGLWQQMESAAPQFRMTIDHDMRKPGIGLSPEQRQQLAPRLERRVNADAIRPLMRDQLAKTLKAEDLPAYDAWFNSATGQRRVAMEQKAEAEAMRMDVDAKLPLKTWHDQSVARQNLLDEITERARAAEQLVSLYEEITPALRRLAEALGSGAFVLSDADLREDITRHSKDMLHPAHQTMRMEYALRFKDLSDDELNAWLAFLKSPAGERFTDAALKASVVVPLRLLAGLAKPEP